MARILFILFILFAFVAAFNLKDISALLKEKTEYPCIILSSKLLTYKYLLESPGGNIIKKENEIVD